MPECSVAIVGLQYATVAGGCFWGIELAFQRVHGVKATCVGYWCASKWEKASGEREKDGVCGFCERSGGHKKDPSYEEVCMTDTGHTEAVQMVYDPEEVSYDHLLGVFQQHHDPTQVNRQGNDVGSQYRSAIFYHNDEQRERAEEWKSQIPECATEIAPEGNNFWPAEEYHQRYLERGGRFGVPQSAEKGCTDAIRCYG